MEDYARLRELTDEAARRDLAALGLLDGAAIEPDEYAEADRATELAAMVDDLHRPPSRRRTVCTTADYDQAVADMLAMVADNDCSN